MATDKTNEITDNSQNVMIEYSNSIQSMKDYGWIVCSEIDRCLTAGKPGIGIMRSSSDYLRTVVKLSRQLKKIRDDEICWVEDVRKMREIVHQMVSDDKIKLYIVDCLDLFDEDHQGELILLTAAARAGSKAVILRMEEEDINECINPILFILQGSFIECDEDESDEESEDNQNPVDNDDDDTEVSEGKQIAVSNDDDDFEEDDEYETAEPDPDAAYHILFDKELFMKRHPHFDESGPFVEPSKKHIAEIACILGLTPMKFQRTTEDIMTKLDTLFAMFPNIKKEDTDLLRYSIMFCHNHRRGIIKGIKPILLVGNPGCGKTRFVTIFSSMIMGQKFTEFIACGASRGASYIMGSTPDYKGAEEGSVLRSLWESNKGCLTLNPIILLDEVDKCSFEVSGNNEIYGALCTILSDQCAEYFKDAFLDIPVHFWPLYFATANSVDKMPEAILDRFHIIHFEDFTYEDMVNVVIPQQYKELREELEESSLPEMLQPEDIDLIYEICSGKARDIKTALQKVLWDYV